MKKKRVNAGDTLKRLPEDPKDAMKDDYDQTKADMENIKDRVTGEDDDK